MTSVEDLVNERNSVLFSLDAREIKNFMVKWGVPVPSDPVQFWAIVYRAICTIQNAPEDRRKIAEEWLQKKGMSTKTVDRVTTKRKIS